MKFYEFLKVLLLTLFGLAGSILVGYLFYNNQIFVPNLSLFQFVTVGISGSFFFALLKYRTPKEQLFGILLIIVLDIVLFIGKSFSTTLLIRDLLYLSSLLLSIRIYYQFIQKNSELRYYLRSLIFMLLYLVFTIIFGVLVYFINVKFELPPIGFVMLTAKTSILIGLGISIGIDFYLQNEKQIMQYAKSKNA